MEKLTLIAKDLITVIIGILILIGIVLLLRRRGGRDVSYGDSSLTGPGVPAPFSGVVDGIEYAVECLGEGDFGNGNEPFMVVHVGTEKDVADPLEVDARNERPTVTDFSRATDINAILDLGSTYIDIGYNCTDWIAAEFPVSRVAVDMPFAERVVRHLLNIKNLSTYK